MSEYLPVRSNGQIPLPAPTRRKAKRSVISAGMLREAPRRASLKYVFMPNQQPTTRTTASIITLMMQLEIG